VVVRLAVNWSKVAETLRLTLFVGLQITFLAVTFRVDDAVVADRGR
jgi:hypothetical protein